MPARAPAGVRLRLTLTHPRAGIACFCAVLGFAITCALASSALATGQFTGPPPSPYVEHLWATGDPNPAGLLTDRFVGIAFDTNGDPWVSSCGTGPARVRLYGGAPLPMLNGSAYVRPLKVTGPDLAAALGSVCGLVNGKNDYTVMYAIGTKGVAKLSTLTGALIAGPYRPSGTTGGWAITVDPQSGDLFFTVTTSGLNRIWRVNPALTVGSQVYPKPVGPLPGDDDIDGLDGIAFDPTGQYLFLALGSTQRVRVIDRNGNTIQGTIPAQAGGYGPEAVDGMAFHACGDPFLISSDNEGNITKYVFPGGNYAAAPTITPFATGGYRGDFVQVGPDGGLYAVQSTTAQGGLASTRYDDGTTSTRPSLVRITPCFVPGTGSLCTSPPGNMVAWWPLDESVPAIAHEVINDAKQKGTQKPPFPPGAFVPGVSGNAYDFSTDKRYVSAGTTVGNFYGDFSVDAWVYLDDVRTGCGTVVDKEAGNAVYAVNGFQLFVNSSNRAGFLLGLGNAPRIEVGTTILSPNAWHHLTYTAKRHLYKIGFGIKFTNYDLRLYVDGALERSVSTATTPGSVTPANTGDFRIGARSANAAPCPFGGRIDEVELFDRVLSPTEALALAIAPKCKCRVEVCEKIQFGQFETEKLTKIRICNDGPDAVIPWSIDKLPGQAGGPCSLTPAQWMIAPSSGAEFVGKGQCVEVPITVTLSSPGLLATDQTSACFQVSSTACGDAGKALGMAIGPTLIDSTLQCDVDFDCFGVVRRPYLRVAFWTVSNTSNIAGDMSWSVRERPAFGDSMVAVVSLGGLPPGQSTAPATLHIAAHDSARVEVPLRFMSAQALRSTHLEFLLGAIGDPSPGVASDAELRSDESCSFAFAGWAQAATDSVALSARSEGSIVFDAANHRLVLFGGYDSTYRNDAWTLDLTPTGAWVPLFPSGLPPAARASHSAIYDPIRHRMLVFGGSDGASYRNDVWALSLGAGTETWTALAPIGVPPTQRRSHTATYDPNGDRMVVFGGYPHTNETWALGLSGTPTWQQLSPSGTPPAARQGHSAVYDAPGQRLVIFGGEDVSNYRNDVWALSLAGAPAWTPITPGGTLPPPRRFQFAALDTATRAFSVFGGQGNGGLLSDVWTLSLADPSSWLDTTPIGDAGPSARSFGFGPGRDIDGFHYMFGGTDSIGATGNLWALPSDRFCGTTSPTVGVPIEVLSDRRGLTVAPNPFRASTGITFSMPSRQAVMVHVYDIAGRLVRKIDAGTLGPGAAHVGWDGLDSGGRRVRAGMYLVRVRFGTTAVIGRAIRVF